jgi:hypothetical protein
MISFWTGVLIGVVAFAAGARWMGWMDDRHGRGPK